MIAISQCNTLCKFTLHLDHPDNHDTLQTFAAVPFKVKVIMHLSKQRPSTGSLDELSFIFDRRDDHDDIATEFHYRAQVIV